MNTSNKMEKPTQESNATHAEIAHALWLSTVAILASHLFFESLRATWVDLNCSFGSSVPHIVGETPCENLDHFSN